MASDKAVEWNQTAYWWNDPSISIDTKIQRLQTGIDYEFIPAGAVEKFRQPLAWFAGRKFSALDKAIRRGLVAVRNSGCP